MDFVTHLPRTQQKHDAVWVIVDRLTKSAHFLVVRMAPYEALYGRPCRLPLCWTVVEESSNTGPDLIRDTSEEVSLIR